MYTQTGELCSLSDVLQDWRWSCVALATGERTSTTRRWSGPQALVKCTPRQELVSCERWELQTCTPRQELVKLKHQELGSTMKLCNIHARCSAKTQRRSQWWQDLRVKTKLANPWQWHSPGHCKRLAFFSQLGGCAWIHVAAGLLHTFIAPRRWRNVTATGACAATYTAGAEATQITAGAAATRLSKELVADAARPTDSIAMTARNRRQAPPLQETLWQPRSAPSPMRWMRTKFSAPSKHRCRRREMNCVSNLLSSMS